MPVVPACGRRLEGRIFGRSSAAWGGEEFGSDKKFFEKNLLAVWKSLMYSDLWCSGVRVLCRIISQHVWMVVQGIKLRESKAKGGCLQQGRYRGDR